MGTTSPDSCPEGKFFTNSDPNFGAKNIGECTLCTAGKFCTGSNTANGIQSEQDCPAGEYSGPGASACLPCQAGHFCDGGTSKEKMLNVSNTCPAGRFCPVGSENADLACQEGYFCPAGTEQMLKCFPGRDRQRAGHQTQSFLTQSKSTCSDPETRRF